MIGAVAAVGGDAVHGHRSIAHLAHHIVYPLAAFLPRFILAAILFREVVGGGFRLGIFTFAKTALHGGRLHKGFTLRGHLHPDFPQARLGLRNFYRVQAGRQQRKTKRGKQLVPVERLADGAALPAIEPASGLQIELSYLSGTVVALHKSRIKMG